jgi:hypothetical protein
MNTTTQQTGTAGHTPGPWFVENIMYGGPRVVYGEAEAPEGFRSDVPWREASEQAQANARLIAASPELLAALQRLIHPMASEEDMDNAQALVNRLTS